MNRRIVPCLIVLLFFGERVKADAGLYASISPSAFDGVTIFEEVPFIGVFAIGPMPTHTRQDGVAGTLGYRYMIGTSNWFVGPVISYAEHFAEDITQGGDRPSLLLKPAVGSLAAELSFSRDRSTYYLRVGGALVDMDVVTGEAGKLHILDSTVAVASFATVGVEYTWESGLSLAVEALTVDYGPITPADVLGPGGHSSIALALHWRF